MNIDQKLDALKKIQRVDAPHFLPTRIRQGINTLEQDTISILWKWAFASSLAIILVLNVSIIIKNIGIHKNQNNIEEMLVNLDLTNSNQLYND
jgi:hypothetical protein